MIYKRIRSLREERNWTREDAAARLEMDAALYAAYEDGRVAIPAAFWIKLSRAYNTSIDYLLGLTDHPDPYEPPKGR